MIEDVSESNLNELLPLIRRYQEFYGIDSICDKKNYDFFSRFGAETDIGCQFVWREAEKVVGFATVYLTFTSTITAKVAVLNDLYVLPDYRGRGVGRKLIEHCRAFARIKGAARLQWVTAPENTEAQRLYDLVNARKSSWYFYAYDV
ncbi:GNAT family N-acetyltransferase [Microbulbifer aggregans]|uniref:GNAT family N-acetyltransferase n=1 Tax=Microbulbifer aggregans TaxID=1769779 RepID=UPI001CFE3437|nr:GNAT family N-acetyltransferase [Microbulbifer aggregans]